MLAWDARSLTPFLMFLRPPTDLFSRLFFAVRIVAAKMDNARSSAPRLLATWVSGEGTKAELPHK